MNRDAALGEIHGLAAGLEPDLEGVRRLLERISAHDDAEALRDALTEVGAHALLDGREAHP